jgi:hypothetical protein
MQTFPISDEFNLVLPNCHIVIIVNTKLCCILLNLIIQVNHAVLVVFSSWNFALASSGFYLEALILVLVNSTFHAVLDVLLVEKGELMDWQEALVHGVGQVRMLFKSQTLTFLVSKLIKVRNDNLKEEEYSDGNLQNQLHRLHVVLFPLTWLILIKVLRFKHEELGIQTFDFVDTAHYFLFESFWFLLCLILITIDRIDR